MAVIVRLPEVLAGVTEAAIQSWLVTVGESVAADTPLAEIETEKAMVEFVGEYAGAVAELLVSAGETVEVGQPILILRSEGDSDADIEATVREARGGAGAAPSARPADEQADTSIAATAPSEAAVTGSPSRRLFASPIVRRIARERGIDLSTFAGTGPGGRIVRRDLDTAEAAAVQGPAAGTAPAATHGGAIDESGESIPLTRMRRAIARRLTESKSSVPHFYLTAHCRVDRLLELRAAVNEILPKKVSVNDFVVKAAAHALLEMPETNAVWGGDHIRRFDTADIAVAVSTEGGLLTPVVRGVEKMSLSALSESIVELAERARAGRLQQHELEGGSFSVSNLGMYGVDEFSAILNPPQAGILAVGAATRQPVVENDAVVVGTVMTVTLSADHRVVDGALGAQWLQAFKRQIENPLKLVI